MIVPGPLGFLFSDFCFVVVDNFFRAYKAASSLRAIDGAKRFII